MFLTAAKSGVVRRVTLSTIAAAGLSLAFTAAATESQAATHLIIRDYATWGNCNSEGIYAVNNKGWKHYRCEDAHNGTWNLDVWK